MENSKVPFSSWRFKGRPDRKREVCFQIQSYILKGISVLNILLKVLNKNWRPFNLILLSENFADCEFNKEKI